MQVVSRNIKNIILKLIKQPSVILLILSIIIFYFGWVSRNFAVCGFGATIFLLFLALMFKKIKILLIPFVAIGFTVSFIELTLNILWPLIIPESAKSTTFSKESNFTFQKVDGFGYLPTEGVFKDIKLNPDGETIYDATYTIGKDGYRLDVPHNEYQIYIYGGSLLFGNGLNDNETLSYFLFKNHGLKSKNLGIGGYGMHQALYNIQKGKTASNGINILYTTPGHAHRSSCIPVYSSGTPRYILDKNKKLILDGVCKNKIKLNNFLQSVYIFKLFERVFESTKYLSDEGIETYLAIVKEFYRLTKQNNSKLIIVYFLNDKADKSMKKNTKWSNKLIIDQYNNFADKTVNVTLAETYEQLPRKYYIHKLDTHPTAKANIERAIIIADTLKRLEEKN